MKNNDRMEWDVAVIGGGPAGLMAAGTAARFGAKVVLLEKNRQCGCKLLLTGSGQCNFTNATEDPQQFLENFGKKGEYLIPLFQVFGVRETLDFFSRFGVSWTIETDNQRKVFPRSRQAGEVLGALLKYIREQKVQLKTSAPVRSLNCQNQQIVSLETDQGQLFAKRFILCTGGLSFPATGSTGDGFRWLETLGHSLIPPQPVLTPAVIREKWISKLEGLSLREVMVTLRQDQKKLQTKTGDLVFTRQGVSGPVIYDLSKKMGEQLPRPLSLGLDLQPGVPEKELEERFLKQFQEFSNKMIKNTLNTWIPPALIPVFLEINGIDPEKKNHSVSRVERKKMLLMLKDFRLTVQRLEGFSRAIITAGGVPLEEIDRRTMRSKKISNLYFAGEIIDIDGPTGGYNLQICWTTGYGAGRSAGRF